MTTLREFQIINKLGQGSFAVVYRVKRKEDGKEYAMKKVKYSSLSQKQASNSLNEIRILASINSNYIIGYKDAFFDQSTKSLFIITEFAAGGDLKNKLNNLKKNFALMEENQIWKLAIQMITGLKVLHNLNIFHRDLKSANIFLTGDHQNIKLGDLNVSIVSKNGMAYTQTGTPYYACPQVWNDKPYNHKSDIWSLGCVLYQMAAQKPPFQSTDMQGLWKKINKGIFDRIPAQYSDDLQSLINNCLKVQANERPTCEMLLKSTLIRKRIHLYPNQQFNKDPNVEQYIELQNIRLLQTIRVSRQLNFKQLKDKLPKCNYDSSEKENRSKSFGKIIKNKSFVDENNLSTSRTPLNRIQNLPEIKRVSSARRETQIVQNEIKKNVSILIDEMPPLPPKRMSDKIR